MFVGVRMIVGYFYRSIIVYTLDAHQDTTDPINHISTLPTCMLALALPVCACREVSQESSGKRPRTGVPIEGCRVDRLRDSAPGLGIYWTIRSRCMYGFAIVCVCVCVWVGGWMDACMGSVHCVT